MARNLCVPKQERVLEYGVTFTLNLYSTNTYDVLRDHMYRRKDIRTYSMYDRFYIFYFPFLCLK